MIRGRSQLRSRNYGSLLAEAYNLSEDFITVMSPLFGTNTRDTPDISFEEISNAGEADAKRNKIAISIDYLSGKMDLEDFKFTVAHENAHCLDPMLIDGISDPVDDKERDETVANLGALVYFARTINKDYADNHARVRTVCSKGVPLAGHTASKLFLSGRTLPELENILKQMSRSKGSEYLGLRAA